MTAEGRIATMTREEQKAALDELLDDMKPSEVLELALECVQERAAHVESIEREQVGFRRDAIRKDARAWRLLQSRLAGLRSQARELEGPLPPKEPIT